MAMSQVRTRKRPAPGASPLSQTQSPDTPTFPQDQTLGWQAPDISNGTFPNPYGAQNQNDLSLQSMQQAQPGSQLARRFPNQPVFPIQNLPSGANGQWQMADVAGQTAGESGWGPYDDLDQRAVVAKREAESKRKQIPPFIQKLSSFLDESRNTDLIRWSDSGDSFVVLDEDEFAKTLIPELFKHRNYASFVRQLNMYGFHKKVGLSDNSMRSSERKNKNPSEYSNPYFKRGRPNLLWLIQKPKSSSTKGGKGGSRAKQEDYDEEVDETFGRDISPLPGNLDDFDDGTNHRGGRQNLLTLGPTGSVGLPQDQLTHLQGELESIRNNQKTIAHMLNEVKKEHKQLYGQAKAFHDLHEKHDNSINAILTFLATVYSKNLDKNGGDMGDMFTGAIPSSEQHRGNVVDMGEVRDQSVETNTPQPLYRRRPLLLEDKKSPLSPDSFQTKKPYRYSPNDQIHSPTIQELSDNSARSTPSPELKPKKENPQMPQADIMSMLNNASAKNNAFSPNAPMDFSEALSHLQNSGGNTPLTPGQRQNMLQLMDNESTSDLNNALTSYPDGSASMDPAAQFDATSDNLDHLGHIIREQGQNIDTLSNTLTPLSPSGSIPGISSDVPYSFETTQDPFGMNDIFNPDDYFNDPSGNQPDINFDSNFDFTDPTGGNLGVGVDGIDPNAGAQQEQGEEEVKTPVTIKNEGGPEKRRRLG